MGSVVWSAKYTSFGAAFVDPGSSVENNLRLPGQYFDGETGYHYNWHRYYDPATGRYLTPDPIGLAGGINLFLYAEANPINYIDPFGLTSLVFNVKKGTLTVDPEQKGVPPYNISALSGKDECKNDSGCEQTPNKGPIPRGVYYIDNKMIDNPSFWNDVKRNFFTPGEEGGGDWGDWRVRIYPRPKTKRYGRTGFYLHGGYISGSSGCIDFGGGPFGNNRLLQDLQSDKDGIIPLVVE